MTIEKAKYASNVLKELSESGKRPSLSGKERIIGLSGSPRAEGNTDIIIKEALEAGRIGEQKLT